MSPSPHVWFLKAKSRLLDRNNKSLVVPDITCRFVHAIQCDQYQNHLSLRVPSLIFGFCMQNRDFWSRITSNYVSQTSPVFLFMQNSVISTWNTSLHEFQPSSVVLCIQNSDLRTKIACVYGSHTSPVIFCMQNSVPSTRNTSLYGSQPSSVVFSCKTAAFGNKK